jgi:ribosomal protein S18 acetylase RimI-like enzyme
VASDDRDNVVGFVVATYDSRSLFRQLIFRRFPQLAARVALALVRQPTLVRSTLETFLYPSKEGPDTPAAELLVIAVDKAHRSQGIGAALVRRLDEDMRARNIDRYKVTVLAENVAASRFYDRLGFAVTHGFNMYGKRWSLLVQDLSKR